MSGLRLMKELTYFKAHDALNTTSRYYHSYKWHTSALPKINLLLDEPQQNLPHSWMLTSSCTTTFFVCFHGMIYPVLCLELCFCTCVYRFTFYPPICRSSMKSRASVFTSGWSYWEHCIDINWYSIRPLMNMGTFLTLTAVQWHLSEQEKTSTSTNTSHIGSMSISAGDAPI